MLERYFIADLADLIQKSLIAEVSMSNDSGHTLECVLLSSRGDLIKVSHDDVKIYTIETISHNVISADIASYMLLFATNQFVVYKSSSTITSLYNSDVSKCLAGRGRAVLILTDGTIITETKSHEGGIVKWREVPQVTNVVDGSCHGDVAVLIRSDGRIYISDDSAPVEDDFTILPTVSDISAVHCTTNVIFLLTMSGNVLYSGDINPTVFPSTTFKPFPLSNVVSMSVGRTHALFLTSDGKLFGYGRNADGEFGIPEHTAKNTLVHIQLSRLRFQGSSEAKPGLKIKKVLCGNGWSIIMDTKGDVYIIGRVYYDKVKTFMKIEGVNLLK